mgnify:CR=1 FL=1
MSLVIKIENLKYDYDDVQALRGIDLELRSGQTTVLLGVNGAGKTTLIKALAGLIEGYSGRIVFEVDCQEIEIPKNEIGLMFEGNRSLFHKLTVIENLIYFSALKGVSKQVVLSEAPKILKSLGLEEAESKIFGKLSRGMQQKVSLTSILLCKPKLLLLDEPTLGMDYLGVDTLIRVINEYSKGSICVLSTHDLHLAKQVACDVCLIEKGKVKGLIANINDIGTSDEFVITAIDDKQIEFTMETLKKDLIESVSKVDLERIQSITTKTLSLEDFVRDYANMD